MSPSLLAVLRFGNIEPGWLWLWALLILAGAAVLVATYWGIFRRSERHLTWLLMLWRGVGLVALLLALAKPIWTTETQLVDAGRVAVVLDNSQSMALPDPSGASRYTRATEAVNRLRQTLAAAGLQVEVFDLTGTRLEGALPKEPTLERTDLAQALSRTAAGLRFKPLSGIILVSDGMDNTGRENFQDLADIANGRPIFTVGFKAVPAADDFDLALRADRSLPERVLVNNDVKVDVVVTKTGGPRLENVTVALQRGLDERFAEQKISLPEGNVEQTVSLTLKPTQPGTFEFSAVVSSDRAEQNLANNSFRFPLRVDAEAIRVLYLEGFLRYEYKYLKNLLEDDPDLNVVAHVRAHTPEASGSRLAQALLTPEQLKKCDVVILGDMEAGYLTDADYQALLAWLEEPPKNQGTGRALLVLGGYRSFGPDGFRTTKLADVLPVVFVDAPPYQSEEPFALKLTEAGRAHPIFEVAGDRVKSEQAWERAPKLAGCSLVRRAKPGAEVLAVNPAMTVEGTPAIVVATQRYGAGRTMVIAADTTWKWSRFPRVLGMPDTLYARFWSQTVRWLAGRGQNRERPLLVVGTDHPGYDVGKKVAIAVTRQPRPGVDLSNSALAVRVAGPGVKPVTVPMRSSSAQPDVFTGSYYPTGGGRYEVVAALTDGGRPLANQGTEFLVHGSNQEKANTGTNPESLRTLARASGGLYYDIDDLDKLVERIPRRERRTVQRADRELWNSWWLFAIFLGAVSTEWLIRRRNHLI